jgi:hypothetical protein
LVPQDENTLKNLLADPISAQLSLAPGDSGKLIENDDFIGNLLSNLEEVRFSCQYLRFSCKYFFWLPTKVRSD